MFTIRSRVHGLRRYVVLPLMIAVLAATPLLLAPDLAPSAQGQVPPPPALPSGNETEAPEGDAYEGIVIVARAVDTYQELGEFSNAMFRVRVEDLTVVQANTVRAAPPTVRCVPNYDTGPDTSGWASVNPPPKRLQWGSTVFIDVPVSTTSRPTPEYLPIHIVCTASGSAAYQNEVIGSFNVTARVEEYSYISVSSGGIPEPIGPYEQFSYTFPVTNNGNHPRLFEGEINAPEGWTMVTPPQMLIEPGETRNVTIQGISPREKPLYIAEQQLIQVRYWPQGYEGRAQTVNILAKVDGVYLHPALIPFLVIAATIIGLLVWLAILAKRQIESQILGKPVPPWTIPVEIEYLRQLQRDDPDEYYVVRHYLMPEEYKSALLWYEAYKKATKSDRKAETKWFKVKRKQEAKVEKLDKGVGKIERKYERKIKVGEWFRGMKIKKLERKNRRKTRKEQRGFDRKRRKKVRKIEKRHRKKLARMTKRYEKRFDKETRKIEKANRKAEKQGLDPQPLPEYDPPTLDDPEFPDEKMVEEVPLMESRYAKRAERVHRRFDKKKERRERARDRKVAKLEAKNQRKREKLLAKIPAEPKTHLYDHDDYVPEEEIVVEDDRSPIAKMLRIPTLEERERARRERMRYQARRKRLQAAGDTEAIARLDDAYKALRTQRDASRDEERAARKEARLLEKERKRSVKERARELAKEAKQEAAADRDKVRASTSESESPSADPAARDDSDKGAGRFRVRKKKATADDRGSGASEAPKEEPPAASSSGEDVGRQE